MFECLVLCCVCVTCDQRDRESRQAESKPSGPERNTKKILPKKGIEWWRSWGAAILFETKAGRPSVLCGPEHGHHCGGYHNTQRAVWLEPVICIFRDLLKLWQKWQSHFLFKIAYPPLLSIYVCIKYSNNTAFLKLKCLCGMRPCDQTQSRACALRTRDRVEYRRAEYRRAEWKDRENDREHS